MLYDNSLHRRQCRFKLILGLLRRSCTGSLGTGGSKVGLLDPVKYSLSGPFQHKQPMNTSALIAGHIVLPEWFLQTVSALRQMSRCRWGLSKNSVRQWFLKLSIAAVSLYLAA
ncbi:hypothetical protein TNCV_1172561 [Trichonephila clavipes]|uniref:Uncharacterized protein n=1 Tax=Trichonephila clavipes TaxID=2585209 RepID=A0A8X6S5K2_TRICX|nr:hypothetical protein TNCV_1172561 [Trichonephila clavipes]